MCEKCDHSVENYDLENPKLWNCFGCYNATLIMKSYNDKLWLLKTGKITRREAVVIWSDDLEYGNILTTTLRSLILPIMDIYKGDSLPLNKDFPEINENTLVIIPSYSLSPNSVKLIQEIAQLFPNDREESEILDDLTADEFYTARVTYSVGELFDRYLDCEILTEEQYASVDPKFLERIFD